MINPWMDSLIPSLVFTVLFGAWFLFQNWRAEPARRQSWLGLVAGAAFAGAIFYGLTTVTNLVRSGEIDSSWGLAVQAIKVLALVLIVTAAGKLVLARLRKT